MAKITACAAKARLQRQGVSFAKDFHALRSSDVQLILDAAKDAGYRRSKRASGSKARMFFQHLDRKKCRR